MKSLEAALVLGAIAMILSLFFIFKVPNLPKPTPNCPECRDATAPIATVKE